MLSLARWARRRRQDLLDLLDLLTAKIHLVGVGAGFLVFSYERRQRREIIRKLEVIRQLNHHVRNSLQVIATAASISEQQELAKAIHTAVGRIEWALREVLPGQREDLGQLSFQPTVGESDGKGPEDRLAS